MSPDSNQRNPAGTDREWLANIYGMLADSDDLTDAEVKESLKAEGLNTDELMKRGLTFIEQQRQLATTRMLADAREKQRQGLEGGRSPRQYEGSLAQLKVMVKERLASWSAEGMSHFALAHRNFEEATENDLKTLLAEMDQLEIDDHTDEPNT